MLLLPNPRRLMLGYWLGAMITSITLGLVIVFVIEGSGAVSTARQTVSPGVDLAFGALFLMLGVVLWTGKDKQVAERRSRKREGKDPPRWQRVMNRGRARDTFVLGALLTLPGASYLAGMTRLSRLDYPDATVVLVVVAFNLVMLILLEAPLLAFTFAPQRAEALIARVKAWAGRRGRHYASRGLAFVGVLLILRGVLSLIL